MEMETTCLFSKKEKDDRNNTRCAHIVAKDIYENDTDMISTEDYILENKQCVVCSKNCCEYCVRKCERCDVVACGYRKYRDNKCMEMCTVCSKVVCKICIKSSKCKNGKDCITDGVYRCCYDCYGVTKDRHHELCENCFIEENYDTYELTHCLLCDSKVDYSLHKCHGCTRNYTRLFCRECMTWCCNCSNKFCDSCITNYKAICRVCKKSICVECSYKCEYTPTPKGCILPSTAVEPQSM